MAEPARRSAAGPAAPGWADLRRQAMIALQAIIADPGDGLAVGVLRDLLETARHWKSIDEAMIEAERNRAVAEDRAARPAARRRGRGRLRAL